MWDLQPLLRFGHIVEDFVYVTRWKQDEEDCIHQITHTVQTLYPPFLQMNSYRAFNLKEIE